MNGGLCQPTLIIPHSVCILSGKLHVVMEPRSRNFTFISFVPYFNCISLESSLNIFHRFYVQKKEGVCILRCAIHTWYGYIYSLIHTCTFYSIECRNSTSYLFSMFQYKCTNLYHHQGVNPIILKSDHQVMNDLNCNILRISLFHKSVRYFLYQN